MTGRGEVARTSRVSLRIATWHPPIGEGRDGTGWGDMMGCGHGKMGGRWDGIGCISNKGLLISSFVICTCNGGIYHFNLISFV